MIGTKLMLKRTIKSAAATARAAAGTRTPARNTVNIIAYHRVVADIAKAESESYYGLVVSAETFRRHCELLKRSYNVVSLETAGQVVKGKRNSHRPIAVLTFDDGYLDFYEEAFPILKQLGLPATVFLPTECIGQNVPLAHDRIFWLLRLAAKNGLPVAPALERAGVPAEVIKPFRHTRYLPALTESLVHLPAAVREFAITELERAVPAFDKYPREYQLLNWDQVREMADAGISFGGHTSNHVVLPLENVDMAESEIEASKRELELQLGQEVTTFAYPNGEFDPAVRRLVARAGYRIAVTTEKKINRSGADLLALGRYSFCEESTRGITGSYSQRIAALRLGV